MSAITVSLQLGGKSRSIKWDNAALFRADEIGLPARLARGEFGYSTLCKMIWAMLSDEDRKLFISPEAVALALDRHAAADAWGIVMEAYKAANAVEETPGKNEQGGKRRSR